MGESLLLGFRDMFRNKSLFILFELSLILISLVVISSSSSLVSQLKANSSNVESSDGYAVVPISSDMTSNVQIVNEINQLLNKGGKTFFYSDQITNQIGFPTVIVIDNAFNKSLDEKNSKAIYSKIYTKNDVKQKIANTEFSEQTIFESSNFNGFDEKIFEYYSENEVVVLLLKTNNLNKWIETEQGLEMMDLVNNLSFSQLNKRNGIEAEFKEIIADSFLYLLPDSNQSKEIRFILLFVYPVVAFLIASVIVAFIIMYVNLFKKLYREYTIHLISGASLKHIFIRNSVFTFTLVSICFLLILFLNNFQINFIFKLALVIQTLLLIVLEILLYIVLKRKNLSISLKGDY